MTNQFQIFGSASSLDYDVLVFVDSLGTITENHDLIKSYNIRLALLFAEHGMPTKPVNANLGVIDGGRIIKVFKGYPFEVNNALLFTYNLHRQLCDNHILYLYPLTTDIKHLKLKRCFRFLLSFYSRIPEWRPDIKSAMRGGFDMRLAQVSKIDFTKHVEFPGKKEKIEDIYKVIAFQLAQTYLLFYNIEIYSKEEVIKEFPFLSPFIQRHDIGIHDLEELNVLFHKVLCMAHDEIPNMLSLEEEIHNYDTN